MKKVLILILAYNAQNHIAGVIDRIPKALWEDPGYQADVIIIDDCSKDATSLVAREHIKQFPYPVRLLRNSLNQGYGGNQKIGYTYAIKHGYDAVVMVHGDGQYPPEKLPDMIAPLLRGEADAVFGSRMLHKKDALAGHMPLYKFAGNIVLTWVQNLMLGAHLSEFHTGFRAYSVAALKRIPFQFNSNVFHFDTDIIIQMVDNGMKIVEIPIPTHYGDEVCHVNGMRYAFDVMVSTLLSRIQKYGIFYAPKFDYEPLVRYPDKSGFASSHSFAVAQVKGKERVLDFGCDQGQVAAHLRAGGANVAGCSWHADDAMRAAYDTLFVTDLNAPDFGVMGAEGFDAILLLDLIQRLGAPEQFLKRLHDWCTKDNPLILLTTPNVAFFIPRFMLLIGQFNYGKRGTLDMKHTRLFTFASLKRLLEITGFNAVEIHGIPAPFPLAVGDNGLGRALLKINAWLIKLSKSLFSYQIAIVARPAPTLEMLMQQAIEHGDAVK